MLQNRLPKFLQPLKVEVYLKIWPYSTTERCRVHIQNLKEIQATCFSETYSFIKYKKNYSYGTNVFKKIKFVNLLFWEKNRHF